jgi:hypothetical protein
MGAWSALELMMEASDCGRLEVKDRSAFNTPEKTQNDPSVFRFALMAGALFLARKMR